MKTPQLSIATDADMSGGHAKQATAPVAGAPASPTLPCRAEFFCGGAF
ncbi:hypothetical protein [Maritimibacter sp. 55A14]|nr:hypothetical protein [Maritimibacter sp. 55A14]